MISHTVNFYSAQEVAKLTGYHYITVLKIAWLVQARGHAFRGEEIKNRIDEPVLIARNSWWFSEEGLRIVREQAESFGQLHHRKLPCGR